jgi:hypothetical protein
LVSHYNNNYFLFSLEKVVDGERWTTKVVSTKTKLLYFL